MLNIVCVLMHIVRYIYLISHLECRERVLRSDQREPPPTQSVTLSASESGACLVTKCSDLASSLVKLSQVL